MTKKFDTLFYVVTGISVVVQLMQHCEANKAEAWCSCNQTNIYQQWSETKSTDQ